MAFKAGSHVRRKHNEHKHKYKKHVNRGKANTSASIRKRDDFLLLTLVLVLARFPRTFSCAYAYACVVHVNQPLEIGLGNRLLIFQTSIN